MIHVFNSSDGNLTFSSFYFFHFIIIFLRFFISVKVQNSDMEKSSDRKMQKTFGKKLGRNIFFERNISPHEIFTLFLADKETKKISLESRNYACLKGEQYFTTTLDKLKAFISILLVGRYTELQRQEIHWERREAG